jgi:hypothetical protein
MAVRGRTEDADSAQKLEREKLRLERTIETLSKRLAEVKKELKELE